MSISTARLDQLAKVNAALQALRSHVEYATGDGWGTVYLDNAKPADMSDKVFRACLASLSKRGLYRVIDGFAWGSVKLEESKA